MQKSYQNRTDNKLSKQSRLIKYKLSEIIKYIYLNDNVEREDSPVIIEDKHTGTQVTRTHAHRHSRAHVRQASTGRGKQVLSRGEQWRDNFHTPSLLH